MTAEVTRDSPSRRARYVPFAVLEIRGCFQDLAGLASPTGAILSLRLSDKSCAVSYLLFKTGTILDNVSKGERKLDKRPG